MPGFYDEPFVDHYPPEVVDVSHLNFPDLRPVNLDKEIRTDRCFDLAPFDPVEGVFICTRAKNHSLRHYTSGTEGIVSKVWS